MPAKILTRATRMTTVRMPQPACWRTLSYTRGPPVAFAWKEQFL